MKLTPQAEPCRNFCILNKVLIPKDPYDGRENRCSATTPQKPPAA